MKPIIIKKAFITKVKQKNKALKYSKIMVISLETEMKSSTFSVDIKQQENKSKKSELER